MDALYFITAQNILDLTRETEFDHMAFRQNIVAYKNILGSNYFLAVIAYLYISVFARNFYAYVPITVPIPLEVHRVPFHRRLST